MILFQIISFCALSLISSFFTYSLSSEISITGPEKIGLIAGALGVECIKLFALIKANNLQQMRKKSTSKVVFLYVVYGFVSVYSILASFGYARSTVDRLEAQRQVWDHSEQIQQERQNLQESKVAQEGLAKTLLAKQLRIGQEPSWALGGLQKAIQEDQKTLNEYRTRVLVSQKAIQDLQNQDRESRAVKKRTMYDVIGEDLGVHSKTIAFIVLFWFALAIELGIFVTSPHMTVKRKQEEW